MYVIDVIPLSRTAPGVLSYRSKADMPIGSIVSITIRRTATQGIVIASMPVTDAKEMLKHARFLLSRSLPAAAGMLPGEFMRAAEQTALYHATSAGAVLSAMFSEQIKLGVPLPTDLTRRFGKHSLQTVELPLFDRVEEYRKKIKECFDSHTSVLLVVPTIPELTFWQTQFRSYKPLVLSGTVSLAKRAKVVEAARTHVGIIIATPSFCWTPIEKLGLAILDRVSSGSYLLPKRPYLSVPYALEALMRERNIPLVIGDYPLPLEYRKDEPLHAAQGIVPVRIINARRAKSDVSKQAKEIQQEAELEQRPWRAIPDEVLTMIRNELQDGGRVVVLAARRGYSPAVICRDCGQAQTDERGMPLSFSAQSERFFFTSDGDTFPAKGRRCQRCDSWNLLPLGVGPERVEEELKKEFPSATILLATPELLTLPRKARALAEDGRRPNTIVIGTEALLPWLYAYDGPTLSKPLGIIASADSLLALPFWRVRERFVRLSYFLSGLVHELVLITRHPEDTAVAAVAHPDSDIFWKEERALRRVLQYPPHGTILTLAIEGSAMRAEEEALMLVEKLASYNPTTLPQRLVRGSIFRSVVVLHLTEGAWPDVQLSGMLRLLPPNVRVRIDPESVW